jgi:hypothetical protein
MKRFIILAALICLISLPLIGDEKESVRSGSKAYVEKLLLQGLKQKISQMDLDIAMDQYKEAKMELFRTQLQAKLARTDPNPNRSEEWIKQERDRLEQRTVILQNLSDELKVQIEKLGRESIAAK